jgi:hypothetical protein
VDREEIDDAQEPFHRRTDHWDFEATRSRGQGRGAMPAAWAQRDDLLQVEGKVPHIAGTSRVVKIECRRQGCADGHDDRLPEMAADLVRHHVAVIATPLSTQAAIAVPT